MLAESYLLERALLAESAGQRSINRFRADLSAIVMDTNLKVGIDVPAHDFAAIAVDTMEARRPRQESLVTSLGRQAVSQLFETEQFLKDNPRHPFFRTNDGDIRQMMRSVGGNALHLLIEGIIHYKASSIAGKKDVDLSEAVGVSASVSDEVYSLLTAERNETEVLTKNDIPFIVTNKRDRELADAVLSITDDADFPDGSKVSCVVFLPAKFMGTGRFMPGSNYVEIGTYNPSGSYPDEDVFEEFGVLIHEFRHAKQWGNKNWQTPSVINELDAYYATLLSLGALPAAQIESVGRGRMDYLTTLRQASRKFASFRDALFNPNPKDAFYVDHNIANWSRKSWEMAGDINKDILPR